MSEQQQDGPKIDFNELAINAVREIRTIILKSDATDPRALFWGLLWEAALISPQQLLMSYLDTTARIYRPSSTDAALLPKLALAAHMHRELLLQKPSADVVALPRKSAENRRTSG